MKNSKQGNINGRCSFFATAKTHPFINLRLPISYFEVTSRGKMLTLQICYGL
jgi:hypothetical protein